PRGSAARRRHVCLCGLPGHRRLVFPPGQRAPGLHGRDGLVRPPRHRRAGVAEHALMTRTFRTSMTALHTWCGLMLGWLLYAIFITGTASYYRPEITQWMQPELRPHRAEPAVLMDRALNEIRRQAPDATTIYVRFPNDRDAGLHLNWQTPDGARVVRVVDAETARIEARDSRGGEFFYRFHFQLQLPYPWGRYIASLAAAFMLVALFTGIVAHRQ